MIGSLLRWTGKRFRAGFRSIHPLEQPVEKPKVPAPGKAPQSILDLVGRRRDVRLWWGSKQDPQEAPSRMVGLAFSGGGIRSATFSLGVIEALARSSRDALSRIDVLSTVSGGGYAGCFLRSLFIPDEGRGIVPKVDPSPPPGDGIALKNDAVVDQYRFARCSLEAGTNERDLRWPQKNGIRRRNPLWWLREHSRYLAPNGPTDYSYAAAYIARNWVAMQYIFLLGTMAVLSIIAIVEALLSWGKLLPKEHVLLLGGSPSGNAGTAALNLPLSPIFWLLIVPVVGCVILSIAYWMTERMSPNDGGAKRQWADLLWTTVVTLIGAAAIFGLAYQFEPKVLGALRLDFTRGLFITALADGVIVMAVSALTALFIAKFLVGGGVKLTSELRRRLTLYLSKMIMAGLAIGALGIIDSLGAFFASLVRTLPRIPAGAFSAVLLPALAYLIKKLPDWFGGPGKGSILSLLQRFVGTIALVAGVVLYGLVAALGATLLHLAAWKGIAWQSDVDWQHLLLSVGIIIVLAILSGTSTGFINLSSLHLFYSSRLTRAYLGASNNLRLQDAADYASGSSIKENHPGDYIQTELYCRADLPAPIHIINTTVNETFDPHSELVARDRKGDVLSIDPGGVRIGRDRYDWTELSQSSSAEHLSIGQWCAISGAAASSGMGRLTNLGFALAFTFANIRLGYWWKSSEVRYRDRKPTPFAIAASSIFGTFIYLFNEMTARYSLGYERKYLTDGGHFENSGAYRLIEAQLPLIIVCDNGADPDYRFQDLENLIRTVRLDFGYEIEVLYNDEREDFISSYGALDASIFAHPVPSSDWRAVFKTAGSKAFVLALRVRAGAGNLDLIWVKPRLLADCPADVLGYASDNPDFPQQSTGDQFFDEAQWESYRKLGDISMTRLLENCPALLA